MNDILRVVLVAEQVPRERVRIVQVRQDDALEPLQVALVHRSPLVCMPHTHQDRESPRSIPDDDDGNKANGLRVNVWSLFRGTDS